ncbi:glutathione transferase [Sarracenia purpurea var. burkii]
MALCTQGKEKERTLKSAIEALEKIEGELKRSENKYFGGESIGYFGSYTWMDLLFVTHLGGSWVHENCRPDPIPGHYRWMNNFLEHPVIKHTLPPRDEMLVYFQWQSKEIGSLLASGIADDCSLEYFHDYGVWCGCCLHQLLRLVALGFCYGVILGCFVVGDGFESLVLGCALGDTVDLARCVRMCLSNIEIAVDLEGHVGADSSFGLGCLGESGSTSLLPCQGLWYH